MNCRLKKLVHRAALTSRHLAAGFGLAAAATFAAPTMAQDGLVVDGEVIADATLFDAAKQEGSLLYYTVNFEDMERGVLEYFKEDTGIDFDVEIDPGIFLEIFEHAPLHVLEIHGVVEQASLLLGRVEKRGVGDNLAVDDEPVLGHCRRRESCRRREPEAGGKVA